MVPGMQGRGAAPMGRLAPFSLRGQCAVRAACRGNLAARQNLHVRGPAPAAFRRGALWGVPLIDSEIATSAPCTTRKAARRGACSPVCRSSRPSGVDRATAALPYLLPLLDGLRFGRFFFRQFPFTASLLAPIFPLYDLYTSLPFSSILVFFAIYLGIIQNVQINRFVRFNAMQAILIDILLILPMLVEQLLSPPLSILAAGYNTVWLYVFFCVVYGMGSCLAGEQPRLPLVADAADQQVR